MGPGRLLGCGHMLGPPCTLRLWASGLMSSPAGIRAALTSVFWLRREACSSADLQPDGRNGGGGGGAAKGGEARLVGRREEFILKHSNTSLTVTHSLPPFKTSKSWIIPSREISQHCCQGSTRFRRRRTSLSPHLNLFSNQSSLNKFSHQRWTLSSRTSD